MMSNNFHPRLGEDEILFLTASYTVKYLANVERVNNKR